MKFALALVATSALALATEVCPHAAGQAVCCQTFVDDVVGLKCEAAIPLPDNLADFKAKCKANFGGKKAGCCQLSLAGVGILCEAPSES